MRPVSILAVLVLLAAVPGVVELLGSDQAAGSNGHGHHHHHHHHVHVHSHGGVVHSHGHTHGHPPKPQDEPRSELQSLEPCESESTDHHCCDAGHGHGAFQLFAIAGPLPRWIKDLECAPSPPPGAGLNPGSWDAVLEPWRPPPRAGPPTHMAMLRTFVLLT